MSGAEALELALGLLRAPARRALLAARPLPAGVTGLLAVAAGSHAALREAAERTGATAGELQEAARFFVQQVLLVDGADAYRTLGATRDAPQARLHEHHRLLQRWLHPDRDTGDSWDSAFSARVNAAWARVRNPRVRQAYDAELSAGIAPVGRGYAPDAYASDARMTVPVGDVAPTYGEAEAPPGRRIPVAAIAVVAIACIALAGYILQRESPAGRGYAPDTPPLPPTPLASAAPPPAPVRGPSATPAAFGISDVGHVGPTYDTPDPPADSGLPPDDGNTPAPVGRGYAPDAGNTTAAPDAAPPVTPMSPAAPATSVISNVGHVGPTYDTSDPPAVPGHAPGTGNTSAPAGPGHAPDAGDTSAPDDSLAGADVGHVGPTYGPDDTAPVPVGRGYAPDARAPATPATPAPPADPFALFEEAEHAVTQLTDWLASDDERSPPIWNDVHTEAAAAAARADLHARFDGRHPGRLSLQSPHWQLGDDRAALDGGYSVGGRRAAESGQLQVRLVRREQRWLVTSVQMEPSP